MNIGELEEFDLAVELAKNNQPQAAYFIFSRLREKYPQNSQVQVLSALTSPFPIETRTVFEAALRLDPADPILALAIDWLEKRPAGPPLKSASSRPFIPDHSFNQGASQLQTIEKPAPGSIATIPDLDFDLEFAWPADDVLDTVAAPEAETIKPVKGSKTYFVPFSRLWWLQLIFSLVFFGSVLGLLYIFVTAKNLNEAEKAYSEGVSELTRKTMTVNTQLQTAITDFNAGKLDRAGLEKELQAVTGLNDELRQLKSPSPRFDKLDGLLGEAYSYFNDGATTLINGLESGSVDQFNEGYRLFGIGNDYLRQSRDELKSLGG